MEWSTLLAGTRFYQGSSARSDSDLRTEFEKDYHRIIGSASFRRLQDKTQVFPLDQSDFIRTRLTHSLEVSSFAKSLGQTVSKKILQKESDSDFTEQSGADMCDILLCAGLIHDIGNPPFGHFGETAIRDWFKSHLDTLCYQGQPLSELLSPQMAQDLTNFEGNAQALRLVTRLHYLVGNHGMNLTHGLLNTIIKYPVSSLDIKKTKDIKHKKMGFFLADEPAYREISQAAGTQGVRHPLTYLLEAADDIAYRTADLEDGFKKGFFNYRQLQEELQSHSFLGKELSEKEEEDYQKGVAVLEKVYEEGSRHNEENLENYAVQNWVVRVQGLLISCASYGFLQNYDAIMEGSYAEDLFHGTFVEHFMKELGLIATKFIFQSKPIIKLEIAANTILNFLLDQFVSAALYYRCEETQDGVAGRLMSIVSENYKKAYARESIGKNEGEQLYLRLLLITDFICGMTDSYAKRLFQELNGTI